MACFREPFATATMALRKGAIVFGLLCLCLCLGWALQPLGKGNALASFTKVDKVVVIKSKRLLMLLKEGEIFKAYRIALGKNPSGHKIKAGDQRTPEGSYIIDSRNARSKFYRAIHISYPNESDVSNAQRRGVSPGGSIMIHGLPNGFSRVGKLHRVQDWTDGCIAVTNTEMEEIWEYVADGTPIEIKP